MRHSIRLYRCDDLFYRGTNVAVKKVDVRKVDPDIVEEFCQEAHIMKRLRHPCLTLFMGVSISYPYLCIVTEFVEKGSMFDMLREGNNDALTWYGIVSQPNWHEISYVILFAVPYTGKSACKLPWI